MSHEITTIRGVAQAAYAETAAWHGLGQILRRGASIEEWAKAAGFDWKIRSSFVRYLTAPEGHPESKLLVDKDHKVLFCDDTLQRVGVVGTRYEPVQPIEYLEFFRAWVEAGGCELESAAWLKSRRKCFALARIGEAVSLTADGKDSIVPYIRVSGSCDGSSATEGGGTTLRIECNNMMQMSLAQDPSVYRCTHRSEFRPDLARAAIEASIKQFGAFIDAARVLARRKVVAAEADTFVRLVLAPKVGQGIGNEAGADKVRGTAGYKAVMELFNGRGGGANLISAAGTAWGLLNAVTDYVDHEVRSTGDDQRLNSAMFGEGAKVKQRAAAAALAMV